MREATADADLRESPPPARPRRRTRWKARSANDHDQAVASGTICPAVEGIGLDRIDHAAQVTSARPPGSVRPIKQAAKRRHHRSPWKA